MRSQKNVSELVYDNTAAGSYIEAALLSLGISDDQLLKNVATRVNCDIKQSETINWPPSIPELESTEPSNELLLRLITLLKCPNKKDINDHPQVRAITSILTSYVTSKRTAFITNLSILIHGLTKNKEVVDLLHKEGLGISYTDVLKLRDLWACNDLTNSVDCPYELADGFPAIAIVDNDDFKMDTLTGAGAKAHRTNVMYVQPERLTKLVPPNDLSDVNVSDELKRIGSEMQSVEPYKPTKKAEPPVRQRVTYEDTNDTMEQRTRGVIHALARSTDEKFISLKARKC